MKQRGEDSWREPYVANKFEFLTVSADIAIEGGRRSNYSARLQPTFNQWGGDGIWILACKQRIKESSGSQRLDSPQGGQFEKKLGPFGTKEVRDTAVQAYEIAIELLANGNTLAEVQRALA